MLNGKGIFHPLFAYHPRNSLAGSQQTLVEIYAPTGGMSEWVPGVGMDDNTIDLVWRGYARVQPNIDWRARTRDHGNEFNAIHAVRVQLSIGQNLHGATYDNTGKITAYGPDPDFAKDFVVRVLEGVATGTEPLVGKSYTVRNALHGDHPWIYNLLCDTGTK